MRTRFVRQLCFLLVAGCGVYIPPVAQPPRPEMTLPASFGRSWDAVIDFFAQDNVPIRTIDRASGLLMAERSTIGWATPAEQQLGLSLAKCGEMQGVAPYYVTAATYNILVRGDSTSSIIRVTASYVSHERIDGPRYDCSSTGKFEAALESFIRERASRPR